MSDVDDCCWIDDPCEHHKGKHMPNESRWYTDEAGEEKAVLEAAIGRESHPYRRRIFKRLRRRIDGLRGDAPDEPMVSGVPECVPCPRCGGGVPMALGVIDCPDCGASGQVEIHWSGDEE